MVSAQYRYLFFCSWLLLHLEQRGQPPVVTSYCILYEGKLNTLPGYVKRIAERKIFVPAPAEPPGRVKERFDRQGVPPGYGCQTVVITPGKQ